jgi:hypothetical protein
MYTSTVSNLLRAKYMISDGLKYEYTSITFDRLLGYQDIEIFNGG